MIYAIVGPTGVGKTKLSVMLAKKVNAEIINCDSMQVYKEFNIGVAKIKESEKEKIPHHLFDVVSVKDHFNAFNYQELGRKCISDIISRGKNVVIVGGTGLYLKALLYDYDFNSDKRNDKLYDFKLIGLTRDRNKLYESIDKRVDIMLKEGLLEEVKSFYDKGIRSRAINTAIGYKELYGYLDGNCTYEEAVDKIKQSSRRYAKRQYTFFNNQFDNIKWYNVDEFSFEDIVNDIKK